MSEEKYKELLEELGRVDKPTEQSEIYYLLYARIAAGLENHEPGSEELQISIGDAWTEASRRLDLLIQKDPKEALDFGLQLTISSKSSDSKNEEIRKWMRGDGPVLLAREELRDVLLDYFEHGDHGFLLVGKLEEYLSFDFSKINSKHDAFEDPDCFLSVATMLLGTKLQDAKWNKNTERLFLATVEKLNNPDVTKVIDYYLEIKDTKWIAEEIKSFEIK